MPPASRYDPKRLVDSLETVELSGESEIATNGVHDGYRRNRYNLQDAFGWVLDDFEPIRRVWLSHIKAGGYIKPHKDASPWWERWQVPIQPSGVMVIDGEEVTQEPGVPFRVKHWTWHEVRVGEESSRIHLVIDRDIVGHEGKGEFELANEEA